MHVRVRLVGRPEGIVVVESKLTKIQEFRRLIEEKFDVAPKLQRLFYGGKLLEDGYTFHDYNIKLNDVIQLMLRAEPFEDITSKVTKILQNDSPKDDSKPEFVYEDAICSLYAVGDLIDMKDREQGAWFEGKIERIIQDPDYVHLEQTSTNDEMIDSNKENAIENKLFQEKAKEPSLEKKKSKGLADYFQKAKMKKNQTENTSYSNELENSSKGLLYKILLEADADSEDSKSETYYCKLTEIRPRARKEIDIKELKVGQLVMINHNTDEHLEKGYWYDFKVAEIRKLRTSYELVGTLYLGPEAVAQNETKARVHDKIYAIEQVVPLSQRSEKYKMLMVTPTERRSSPLNCVHCRDDEDAPCKECGCYICLGKVNPEKIILCDECNRGYHMGCLSPPLTSLPADDEDWYCPGCKRDASAVVAPGAAQQRRKTAATKSTRDWGRGMACVGKTKSSAMPANHFGPIPGIEVGMCWRFRIQLSESGVHRPPVSGIHGRDVEGAYSIVLAGGYEDDYDNGDEFTYTGSGGRDLSGNKRTAEQSCDQTLTRENKALARNCAVPKVSEEGGDAAAAWREGRPVRVVRSCKMIRHFPQYAPKEGIRYDGIYKVVKYYPEKGKSGFRVWKYLLRRDDPAPAPWEEGAKQYPIVYPDGYLEAEAEKKALKEKGGKGGKGGKVGKSGKKRAVERSPTSGGEAGEESPPTKRRKTRAKPELSPKVKEKVSKSPRTPKIADIFTPAQKSPKSKEGSDEQPLFKDEMAAIKADELNSKLWEECLATCKEGGKKEFVERVTQVFLCIICQEIAASPVTTACRHNFCQGCLKLAFRSTGAQTCPCCRRDLSKEHSRLNEALQTALRTIMPGYDAGKK